MSFVSVVMLNDFISVVADGQATNSDGSIHAEDIVKITGFGTNKFATCTGSLFLLNKVFDKVIHYDDLEVCATDIHKFINQEEYIEFTSSVVIGGINKNDQVEFFYINNHDDEQFIRKTSNKEDYCERIFLCPDVDLEFEETLMPTFDTMLQAHIDTLNEGNQILLPEDIEDVQIQLNEYVAENVNTVNKNITSFFIKKPKPSQFGDFQEFLDHLSKEAKGGL